MKSTSAPPQAATRAGVGVAVMRPALMRSLGRAWWNQANVKRLTANSISVATAVRMDSNMMRFRRISLFSCFIDTEYSTGFSHRATA